MLKNETYIGDWHYNKLKAVESKKKRKKFCKRLHTSCVVRDKKEWVKIKIPAIIDKKIFELSKEIQKRNYKIFGDTKETYILGRILWCDKCGFRMVGCKTSRKTKKSSKNHFYYRCSHQSKHFPSGHKCYSFAIKREELERAVWDMIKKAIQNPKILLKYISHLKEEDGGKRSLLEQKEGLLSSKEQIKKKKNRLLELYETEGIEKDELLERIGEHTKSEEQIERSLKETNAKLSQTKDKDIIIKSLQDFSSLTKRQLDTLKPEQIKVFLKHIIKRVSYNSDNREIKIVGYIPVSKISEKEKKEMERKLFQTFNQAPIFL